MYKLQFYMPTNVSLFFFDKSFFTIIFSLCMHLYVSNFEEGQQHSNLKCYFRIHADCKNDIVNLPLSLLIYLYLRYFFLFSILSLHKRKYFPSNQHFTQHHFQISFFTCFAQQLGLKKSIKCYIFVVVDATIECIY